MAKTITTALAFRPRPTAFLTGAPEHAITILCRLQAAGIRVPAEVSVLCGWDDNCLDFTYPAISHYRTSGEEMGRKIGRMLMDLIEHGSGKARTQMVMPEFVAGGTLGPSRGS